MTYTIKVLDEREGGPRTVLFQRRSESESIEISAETDTPNLLASLPELLDATLEIQRSLWPAQRVLSKLPSSFFPLLAAESRLLRSLTSEGATSALPREIERRRIAREAMIVRDIAWEALRNALGPRRRGEIDALVGASESPDELAASMDAIAILIDRMLADAADSDLCAICDIDAEYAAALRDHAVLVRAAFGPDGPGEPDPVTMPRGLLRIISAAFRVLRTEAFLIVPTLHTMGRAIEARRPPERRS